MLLCSALPPPRWELFQEDTHTHTFVVAQTGILIHTHTHTHTPKHTEWLSEAKITSVADRQTVLIYFKECPVLENMCQYEA